MLAQLESIGLSEDESSVYLALLELGGGYVSAVAKRAGRNRSTSYHTLSKLHAQGLVSKVKKGSYQYFLPESPDKLVQLSKFKYDTAANLLPELLSLNNSLKDKPKVKFFERASGIEQIFISTLAAKEEILGYTNLTLLAERYPEFFRKYTNQRIKKGIRVRYLSPRLQENVGFLTDLFPKKDLLEILFIDSNQFPFQNEISIFDNKVAIMSLALEEPIGLLIESKTVSKTMRAIFDLAWIGASSFIAR